MSKKWLRLPLKLIACLAMLATASTLVGVTLVRTASAAPPPVASPAPKALAGLRLMNYYPANNAWTLMWSNWSAPRLAADFEAIAAVHANAVRLIVSPAVFGWPVPSTLMLARLHATVALASAAHLQVELTIFDLWPDYTDFTASNTWATAILTPYADDHEIAFVETRNEVDVNNPQEMAWLREQIPFDKEILHTVPVTASVTGSITTLAAARAKLAAAGVDFLDWHYFSRGTPTTIYNRLLLARSIAGSMGLFIGEAGAATMTNASTTPAQANQDQLTFYEDIDWATKLLGLPDAAPWIFDDFTPTAIPPTIDSSRSPQEYRFGLRSTAGLLKPAGLLTASFFATGQAPSVINGKFVERAGASVADWAVYHRAEGTFTWRPGVSKSGGGSLEISGSGGDKYGLPSYDTVLPLAPASAGGDYRVSAWVRGVRETGVTVVALAWFDSSGKWLGDTRSAPLAGGTTAWTQLTAAGPGPLRATKVMVYLQASQNRGATWFSDLTWTIE